MPEAPSVTVIGSLNQDIVLSVPSIPRPGETLLASRLETHPGGKGGNQAVAAARAGARVRMIARVGDDDAGRRLLASLAREGIDALTCATLNGVPTGQAFIPVAANGENCIIVAPGANARLHPDDLDLSDLHAAVTILQLEIPLETVLHATRLARATGACVILNAAPAATLAPELLEGVNVLVVNETEAEALCGAPVNGLADAPGAARLLAAPGRAVVITLGARGAYWLDGNLDGVQPAFPVEPVDTTAAGDAFVGALAVALAEGATLAGAVRRGCAAGAITATRRGAQPSLPSRAEIDALAGPPENS